MAYEVRVELVLTGIVMSAPAVAGGRRRVRIRKLQVQVVMLIPKILAFTASCSSNVVCVRIGGGANCGEVYCTAQHSTYNLLLYKHYR